MLKIKRLEIPDVVLIEPKVYSDNRGLFFESFNQKKFEQAVGVSLSFFQDNQSFSEHHVLRGLHYQVKQPQGKIVRVISGEIYDVAVDLRRSSITFGKWVAAKLSDANKQQLWIPPGFAHGFLTLSQSAEVIYKTTSYYDATDEATIIWNDSKLNIAWPSISPILSPKDKNGLCFEQSKLYY